MKQNVVFLTKLRYDRGISDPSKLSWGYWCKKNNHKLFVHEGENPWLNLFNVFTILEENNIEYDKIFVINGSSIVKWDCPNIFELTDDRMTAWLDKDNWGWIYQSVVGYNEFFKQFNNKLSNIYEILVFKSEHAGPNVLDVIFFSKSFKKRWSNMLYYFQRKYQYISVKI